MLQEVLAAVIAFVSTNIDDLFILMALYLQTGNGIKPNHIVSGQYLGIATLIALSLAGVFLGLIVPTAYIGLLGLFPVYIGIQKLWQHYAQKHDDEETDGIPKAKTAGGTVAQVFSVAAITIANGGDNVGIYVPFFSAQSFEGLALTVSIFLALTGVWLFAARYLTKHPALAGTLHRVVPAVFPFLLIGLGVYIMHDSGTFAFIF
jgi:cadmium resistance transport/sequestration family protein